LLKELEDEDRPRLRLVVLDPFAGAPAAQVETDLSYVASVAAHALRRGAEVELVTPEGSIGPGQGEASLDRILECLALYEVPRAPRPVRIVPDGSREVRIQLGSGAAATGARP
jgi:uncharacterized protein (DUF58 family)